MSLAINDYFVKESTQVLVEGEEPVYTMVVPGVTTVTNDATLAMYVYRGNTNVTSTTTSGSMSSSGNVVILKKLSGLIGKSTYVVTVFGTADGVLRCLGAVQLDVRRKGEVS